jgi:transcriptional regulator with XRE-family HTH domain
MPSQSDKTALQNRHALAGKRLQELRQAAGLTLVALAASLESDFGKPIDAGHISKIENGKIKMPLVGTLETILAGLHANYRNRREVLEAFGYTVPMTLPTELEIREAVRLSRYELHDTASHPVFLLDQAQRLWAWNRYTPRMIGMHPDDPATQHFRGVTMFDLTLSSAYTTRLLIDNPDEYLPVMLQFTKAGMAPFHEQAWYQELIARARTLPGFSSIWDSVPAETYRRITPIRLKLPKVGILQFRVSSAELLPDPRFHMMHFTPFGARTLRVCAEWAEEEGML